MRTMCSREIFTKKCPQQQIFDSDLKGAWHYNHVTFTPIARNFMLYCRLIYMLSILFVRLTIKVKVGIPESFKVGWYPPKKTGSSHLKHHVVSFRLSGTIPLQSVERYLDIADPFIKTKLRFKILHAHLQSSTMDNIFLISMNFRIPLLKSCIFPPFFSFYSFSSIFI